MFNFLRLWAVLTGLQCLLQFDQRGYAICAEGAQVYIKARESVVSHNVSSLAQAMFVPLARSSLLVLLGSVWSASAAPGLSLKLSGAQKVSGVSNLKVTATVTNTGDDILKLLNDPRGPLSKFPTETFEIAHQDTGASPTFTGVKVRASSPFHDLSYIYLGQIRT